MKIKVNLFCFLLLFFIFNFYILFTMCFLFVLWYYIIIFYTEYISPLSYIVSKVSNYAFANYTLQFRLTCLFRSWIFGVGIIYLRLNVSFYLNISSLYFWSLIAVADGSSGVHLCGIQTVLWNYPPLEISWNPTGIMVLSVYI